MEYGYLEKKNLFDNNDYSMEVKRAVEQYGINTGIERCV